MYVTLNVPFGLTDVWPISCVIGRPGWTRNCPKARPKPGVAGVNDGKGSEITSLLIDGKLVPNVQVKYRVLIGTRVPPISIPWFSKTPPLAMIDEKPVDGAGVRGRNRLLVSRWKYVTSRSRRPVSAEMSVPNSYSRVVSG